MLKHKNFFEPFRSLSNWKTTEREVAFANSFIENPMIDDGHHKDKKSVLEMSLTVLKKTLKNK